MLNKLFALSLLLSGWMLKGGYAWGAKGALELSCSHCRLVDTSIIFLYIWTKDLRIYVSKSTWLVFPNSRFPPRKKKMTVNQNVVTAQLNRLAVQCGYPKRLGARLLDAMILPNASLNPMKAHSSSPVAP